MWPYYPDLLSTPVPRYTSFPTAAEFAPDIAAAETAEAISRSIGDLSLYLHIPFCEKICWYCGCNTAAANRVQRLSSYLQALHREIELVGSMLPAGARVRRIALGGGSPNAIAPVDMVRLFEVLVIAMPLENPVISIELDPRTLTPAWGEVLQGLNITRASLGVQTFAPALQAAIGREQPLCMIDKSVRLLREAGVTSLNFDLMYGLPGQSQADLDEALALSAGYGADRIALFGYAHVPHLLPRQRRIDATALPVQEERFHQAEAGYAQLLAAGYQPVGFDHFALPGDPLAQASVQGTLRRNFQGFTDDQAPVVIGLGASAISSFPDLLAQNEKNAGRYRMMLSQNRLPTALGRRRTADDRRRGAAIEGILCEGAAKVERELLESALPRLRPFIERKLCVVADGWVRLSPHALPYARSIAAAFDPYRQDSARRFSSAV